VKVGMSFTGCCVIVTVASAVRVPSETRYLNVVVPNWFAAGTKLPLAQSRRRSQHRGTPARVSKSNS